MAWGGAEIGPPSATPRRHYSDAARQGRINARRRMPAVPVEAPSDEPLKKVRARVPGMSAAGQ